MTMQPRILTPVAPPSTHVDFYVEQNGLNVTLKAKDSKGRQWLVAEIMPNGMRLYRGISWDSNIPVDASGAIIMQPSL